MTSWKPVNKQVLFYMQFTLHVEHRNSDKNGELNMSAEWDSDDDLPLNNNQWDSDDEVPLVEGRGNEDDDDDGNDINLPEDLGNMWTANVTDSIRIQNFTRNVGLTHILSADKKELDFFGRM